METRRLLAVDAAGWTVLTPSGDSRVIYVDNTPGGIGKDTNSGLSTSAPVFSFDKAVSLTRSGYPDWILLKRGTVHNRAVSNWNRSGRSAEQPMVISAYGPATAARPRFVTGTASTGFSTETRSTQLAGGLKVRNVTIRGIEFTAGVADTTSLRTKGFLSVGATENFLIEDCVVRGYQDNVTLLKTFGPVTNFKLRRSIVADAYGANSSVPGQEFDNRSQGLYAEGASGLLLEENLFDHNGWNASVAGAGPNMFSHNVYIQQDNDGVVVRGNIIANGSGHGLQARAGGIVRDNLFLSNPFGMSFGYFNVSTARPGGVSGEVSGNVILGSRDVPWDEGEWAMEVGNIRPGAATAIRDNLIKGDTTGNQPAIRLHFGENTSNPEQEVGINDLTVEGNTVYGWTHGMGTDPRFVPGGAGRTGLNDLTVRNNTFQRTLFAPVVDHGHTFNPTEEAWSGNRYGAVTPEGATPEAAWFSLAGTAYTLDGWRNAVEPTAQAVSLDYVDPNRSAASYNQTLGGAATQQAFLSAVRAQSQSSWRPELTATPVINYVKAGFAIEDPNAPAVVRAAADAYVRDGVYAGEDFGQAVRLEVKQVTAPGYTRESYLRFDLSRFASADEIGTATVRLFGKLLNTAAPSAQVGLYPVANASWSESGLTWNGKPAAGATALAAATVSGTAGKWYEFDVTAYAKQQKAAGATAVAFALKATAAGEGWAGFSSDEAAASQPQLLVQKPQAQPQAIVVSTTNVAVPEGGSAAFTVRLAAAPASAVTVNVTKQPQGDADLNAGTQTLTFTASNWSTPQIVTVTAAQDADANNGTASFELTSEGLASKSVTATEQDDDEEITTTVSVPAAVDAYVRDGTYATQEFGNETVLQVKNVAAPGYTRESYLTFDLAPLGVAADITSAKLRVFGRLLNTAAPSAVIGAYLVPQEPWSEAYLTWETRPASAASPAGTTTVTGTIARWYEFDVTDLVKQERADGEAGLNVALKAMTVGEGWAGFNSEEAAANRPQLVVTQRPSTTPQGLVVRQTAVAPPEGGYAAFPVRLATSPAADVLVAVTKQPLGDPDLTADVQALTFEPDDWFTEQWVRILAAHDADAENGSASFVISSEGLAAKSVTATEQDDDVVARPVTVRAGADAYVRDGTYAGQNFGSALRLEVKKVNVAGYSRESYLRFDLSQVRSASAIATAKLRLFGRLLNTAASSAPVGVYSVSNTSWSESGLTWNNRPAAAATPLATNVVTGTAGRWYEFDLTSYLKQQKAAGATAVAFVLRATVAGEGWAGFTSDEAASDRPELVVA